MSGRGSVGVGGGAEGRECAKCGEARPQSEYSKTQWNKGRDGRCTSCTTIPPGQGMQAAEELRKKLIAKQEETESLKMALSTKNVEAEQLVAAARSSSAEQVAAAEAEKGRAKAELAEAQRVARRQAMAADEERKRAAELELKLRDIELKFSSEPEPEPEPEPETKTKTETETEKEASKAASCPVFRACEAFVASFNLTEGTFDSSKNICYCSQHCARRHPDQRARGTRPYGFPKGWCGFGLQIDAAEYKRRKIFDDCRRFPRYQEGYGRGVATLRLAAVDAR